MSNSASLVVYPQKRASAQKLNFANSKPQLVQSAPRRKRQQPRRKARGLGTGDNGQILVLGADASQKVHIPPPFPMGPYTVLRSRTVIDMASSAISHKVYLIGPHFSTAASQANINDIICIDGIGGDVPGTTENYTQDVLINSYANTAGSTMAQLHACSVVVATASSMTTAQGNVHMGVLNQRIRRSSFATYNALGIGLKTRQEMRPYTGGALLTPAKVTTYPVDVVDWAAQDALLSGESAGTNVAKDTLGQIAIVFSPAATTYYSVTIYCEWRVNFTDTVLASTATKKTPSPNVMWDSIVNAGQATGGFIHDALGNAAQAGMSKFFQYASGALMENAQSAIVGMQRQPLAITGRTLPLMIADA